MAHSNFFNLSPRGSHNCPVHFTLYTHSTPTPLWLVAWNIVTFSMVPGIMIPNDLILKRLKPPLSSLYLGSDSCFSNHFCCSSFWWTWICQEARQEPAWPDILPIYLKKKARLMQPWLPTLRTRADSERWSGKSGVFFFELFFCALHRFDACGVMPLQCIKKPPGCIPFSERKNPWTVEERSSQWCGCSPQADREWMRDFSMDPGFFLWGLNRLDQVWCWICDMMVLLWLVEQASIWTG